MNEIALRSVPFTLSGIRSMADRFVEQTLSGEVDVLEGEMVRKSLETFLKLVKEHPHYRRAVLNEASRYPGKTFTHGDASITRSSRTTYDYKDCGDSVWNELDRQKREREEFLKSLVEPVFLESTGEEVHPPSRSTTEYLTVTLPR